MIAKAMSPFQLHRDESGRLVLTDDAGSHVVEPIRAFPVSDPERWISLVDSHGHELVGIPDLNSLPRETSELIRSELAQREFLPRIEKVIKVVDNKEPEVWDVVTDRGPVRFLMRNSDEIRRLGPHRAILLDMYGVRYYIADSRQLDAHSQRILSKYL